MPDNEEMTIEEMTIEEMTIEEMTIEEMTSEMSAEAMPSEMSAEEAAAAVVAAEGYAGGRIPGSVLKWVAIITMFIDHIGAGLIEKGYYRVHMLDRNHPDAMYQLDLVMRGVGRLAFPIFCFLIVEGYLHTRSVLKYVRNLLIFGLISEVPFDLLFRQQPIYWEYNNVYMGLLLGLIGIFLWDTITKGDFIKAPVLAKAGAVLSVAAMSLIAGFGHADYNFFGPLVIFCMFVFRKNKVICFITTAITLVLCSLSELYALFAFFLIFNYNGKRGRQFKWFFYLFYPVHLMILFMIRYSIYGF